MAFGQRLIPNNPARKANRKLCLESLESRLAMAAQPIINEVLASNNGVIQDVDGDYPDFIELYNQGDAAVNLAGWRLTDDSDELSKWQFPSVNLAPGGYLVVLASNKDRAVAGSQLHTNFALAAEGEFLALVRPDGTIASQFSPTFPPQFEDVSYGVSSQGAETFVIGPDASARAHIPANGNLGTAWTSPGYVPGADWPSGVTGVGYSAVPAPPVSTTVLEVDFNARNNSGNTYPGFSSFVLGGSGIQTAPVTRTYGSISVTLTDVSGLGFDDRSRSTPTNSGAFTEAQLLQDFVFSREAVGTSGFDVAISGLTSGQVYTLTAWSFDSGSTGARTSDWSANGVTVENYTFSGNTLPGSNDIYRFGMVVSADNLGKITLAGRKDADANDLSVFLNALRLETGDTLNPPDGVDQVLRIDFNDRTEGEAGSANTESGYATMTLDVNGATFGGAQVTFSAFGGAVLDDRDRSAPLASGGFTLDQVYDDFIFASGPVGGGMEILLEGLAPGARYDLVLRSLDGTSSGVRQSTWTEVSSGTPVVIASPYSYNAANVPASNDANAIRASLVTSPQGTLVLRGVQLGSSTSVVVNALELTRANFDELIGLDVEASMRHVNSSAYIRVPFDVTNLAAVGQVLLDVQYDAGFIAYINGQEVARRNAPTASGVAAAFNASATAERSNSEALTPETIDLTAYKHLLTQGSGNVLAIHGLNSGASDEDFLIVPRLRTIAVTGQSLRYFQTPTPGAFNGEGVIDFVSKVETSVSHGFFDAPFSVELATATAGANVYYTIDGSIPTPENSSAFLYKAPIFVSTTRTLRAAAVKSGFAASPITTESYIFLEDVLTQDPLSNPNGLVYPAIWQGNASGDYGVDPNIVAAWDDNNPANVDFGIREALLSIPTISIVMDHDDLWNASTGIYPNSTSQGDAWRRPGSVEFIDPNGGGEFQYDVGVQMHGAASRDNARLKKHSFRLIFSGEYGPRKLEFPLFDNSDFDDINTVVLKAAFTDSFATRTVTGRYSPLDSTYTRDVFMLDSQRAMGSLAPDATYVHLYINGLYWGLYYPAERTDDAYLASHIGGAEEDWDVIKDFNELFRGNKDSWNAMFALAGQLSSASGATADAIYQQLQGKNADGTVNPAAPVYLDVDNLIDYMFLHLYAGVEDWPSHNWVAARNRVDSGKGFQFFTWDQEIALDGRFHDRTEANNAFTPAQLYYNLRNSPEFQLRFADRVERHLFNDGAMTNAASQARWQARADQIEPAIIGESARWGDARAGEVVNVPPQTVVPVMTVDHWRASIADVRDSFIPQSHALAISRFQADGLFPTVDAPSFSQFGGSILPGFGLGMSTTSGGATIYYTTNGEDPRLAGGGIHAGSASAYTGNVPISVTTTVKARTLVGTTWSGLTEATFVPSQGSGGIVISEINYHPHAPTAAESAAVPGVQEDDFEFIEILNTHPTDALSLNNLSLVNGLSYTFGNVTLPAGQRALVVENIAAFQARYGTSHNVLGSWSGGLSNSGETIELRNAVGGLVMAVNYADGNPWSEAPDGDGATLELVDPSETPVERLGKWYSWRASTEFGGTPGAAGAGAKGVVINEVLTHSNSPQTDSIELHNTTSHAISIGGWYLSDSGGTPLKYQIPLGTVLPAGGYIVFDEADFNPASPAGGQIPFAMNAAEGDDVFLVIADGSGGVSSIVDSVHFGAAFEGQTFGRTPNGAGRLTPMLQPTLGAANSAPRVGALVITEISYQPSSPSAAALAIDPTLTAAHLEFVEIYNRSASTASLTNNGIAGGVTFAFTPGTTLPAGKTAVVVSFDPAAGANAARLAAFRAHYGIDSAVAIAGPFQGTLADAGARLELYVPDAPPPETPALIPKVLADEVLYDHLAQWPTIVGGSGYTINRTSAAAFGNSGGNWLATAPSPGAVAFIVSPNADFDSDGDVDGADFLTWQRGLGAAPITATRANGNADGDQDVDAFDLAVWRSQFGSMQGAGAIESATGEVAFAAETVRKLDSQELNRLSWVETYVAEKNALLPEIRSGGGAQSRNDSYERLPSRPFPFTDKFRESWLGSLAEAHHIAECRDVSRTSRAQTMT